jgi:hypothetical protein
MKTNDIDLVSQHATLLALRVLLAGQSVILNRIASGAMMPIVAEMIEAQKPIIKQIDDMLAAISEHVKAKDQSMPDFMPGASGGPQQ